MPPVSVVVQVSNKEEKLKTPQPVVEPVLETQAEQEPSVKEESDNDLDDPEYSMNNIATGNMRVNVKTKMGQNIMNRLFKQMCELILEEQEEQKRQLTEI